MTFFNFLSFSPGLANYLSLLHFFIFKALFLTENWINCVYSSTAVHAFIPYVCTHYSHKIKFHSQYSEKHVCRYMFIQQAKS